MAGVAILKLLEQRILDQADIFGTDVLKVDMFLNHQIDVELLNEIGKEFFRLYSESGINKILTVEASGIGIACITAQYFSVPVVFAKKGYNSNVGSDIYTSDIFSFTKGVSSKIGVSHKYLGQKDKVLIIDDFLANGSALTGLIDIVRQAGAFITGIGIVIEKGFQPGGRLIRESGIRIESLAVIKSMVNGNIIFG